MSELLSFVAAMVICTAAALWLGMDIGYTLLGGVLGWLAGLAIGCVYD